MSGRGGGGYRGGGGGGYRGGGGGGGGGGGRGGKRSLLHTGAAAGRDIHEERRALVSSIRARVRADEQSFDASVGYARCEDAGVTRTAYLVTMCAAILTGEDGTDHAALDMFFLEQDGSTFKASVLAAPYFYISVLQPSGGGGGGLALGAGGVGLANLDVPLGGPANEREREIQAAVERLLAPRLAGVAWVERDDLSVVNHLAGGRQRLLRVASRTQSDHSTMVRMLRPYVEKNSIIAARGESLEAEAAASGEPLRLISELREFDVPYVARVSIDLEIRCGKWYDVTPEFVGGGGGGGGAEDVGVSAIGSGAPPPPSLVSTLGNPSLPAPVRGLSQLLVLPEPPNVHAPRVCAFDIECTKAPLKFPDAATDSIYMISYMVDGIGFLLINREVVSEDVPDFDYTPLDEYPGQFTVVNLADEAAVLRHWIDHMRELKINIYVTYNGDYFDWPFIDARARVHGLSVKASLGIVPIAQNGRDIDASAGDGGGVGGYGLDVEWRGRTAVHIDW
jgi:DNA polymerase epsilon subunit 1